MFALVDVEGVHVGLADDPGFLGELGFQLLPAPAGIADEGADGGELVGGELAGFVDLELGVADDVAGGDFPMKSGEGQLVGGDGAADEDRQVGKRAHVLRRQEVGDDVSHGAVDDEAVGAFLGIVRRHEDDGAPEIRVDEAGMRD